jgi:hypothetical protein
MLEVSVIYVLEGCPIQHVNDLEMVAELVKEDILPKITEVPNLVPNILYAFEGELEWEDGASWRHLNSIKLEHPKVAEEWSVETYKRVATKQTLFKHVAAPSTGQLTVVSYEESNSIQVSNARLSRMFQIFSK